jgi:hypothetical protein
MANRKPVQYIQFYTDGSAARQPEIRPVRKPLPRPRKARKPRYVLYVCPVALCGILAAAVLLVMMAVGSVRLYHAKQAQSAMAEYVAHLEWDNSLKKTRYEASLDLDKIYRDALAFGFISQELVPHLEIPVETPQ